MDSHDGLVRPLAWVTRWTCWPSTCTNECQPRARMCEREEPPTARMSRPGVPTTRRFSLVLDRWTRSSRPRRSTSCHILISSFSSSSALSYSYDPSLIFPLLVHSFILYLRLSIQPDPAPFRHLSSIIRLRRLRVHNFVHKLGHRGVHSSITPGCASSSPICFRFLIHILFLFYMASERADSCSLLSCI
jgi:hypothetical protein